MKTAILLPSYNKSKTIEKAVTDFKTLMSHADIYGYDNNSTGSTAELLKIQEQL